MEQEEIKPENIISKSTMIQIVRADIDEMLADSLYTEKEMPGDKYKLAPHNAMSYNENKFHHGIKEPEDLKKLKSMPSLIEYPIMLTTDDDVKLNRFLFSNAKYVSVYLPELPGNWYILLSQLKKQINECLDNGNTGIKSCNRGDIFFAMVGIYKQYLYKRVSVPCSAGNK